MSAINYNYSLDNVGNMVPHPDTAYPVLASGQTITATTAGTNYTCTVKCGHSYVILATVGNMLFGVTGTVATAANIEWVASVNTKVLMRIPQISTGAATRTLNFTGTASSSIGYLVELAERA